MAAASGGKTQYLLPPRRVLCDYQPGNYHLYRGQTFDVANTTKALLVLHVAPKENSYTLVDAQISASVSGGSAAGGLQWVSDKRPEKTQRLLIPAGATQAVTPPTDDGAYVTVCRELEVDGSLRDVLVGDVDRFVKRADLLKFFTAS